ncbi:MAG TPA: TolC family protein, partial [Planctomycetota bacterium]|nr:TolC family protein [Planctomycetota bacterium]
MPPPIEAPAAWTEAHAGDGRLAPDWWTAFRDPRLDTLVARALARNHDLEAAAARLAAAIAQGRIAGAELWPTLDASLGADRQRRVFVGFPFGAGVPSITFNQFGVSLATSWELDLWGRVRAGRNAAQASAEAAAADYAAAALSIAGQTCKAGSPRSKRSSRWPSPTARWRATKPPSPGCG